MREQNELASMVRSLVDGAGETLRQQPELREAVAALGRWLTRIAQQPAGASPSAGQSQEKREVEPEQPQMKPVRVIQPALQRAASLQPSQPPTLHEVPLELGNVRTKLTVPGSAEDARAAREASQTEQAVERERRTYEDVRREPILSATQRLTMVAQRCRLKARGVQWAMQRRQMLRDGADLDSQIKPTDWDIIGQAKQMPNCYVWAMDPWGPNLPEDGKLEEMAGNYEILAEAAELALRAIEQRSDEGQALPRGVYELVAEAQSALRRALEEDIGLAKADYDQREVYLWLCDELRAHQIHLARYMRIDDPADSASWRSLGQRLQGFVTDMQRQRDRGKVIQQALTKAQYHINKISEAGEEEHRWHWQRAVQSVAALVEEGMPPSSPALRELLLPRLEEMPEDIETPEAVELVLREIDRYLASRESETGFAAPPPAEQRSREVREAAELLRDRVVVLIGGEERRQAKAALEEALQLAELRWIAVDSHASVTSFESAVARPETAVVLLAIRWVSHSHEGVKALCQRYDKPYVRLPGGYNPNQVAYQILTQVGEKLRESVAVGGAGA